jgi:hypothetical protein
MTVNNEHLTTILKIVEMMLLKYLTKGKILPVNNAFGDKYNVTGKLFYM